MFYKTTPLGQVIDFMILSGIDLLEQKTVSRTGAMSIIESIYIRDPDGNLIEISNYI